MVQLIDLLPGDVVTLRRDGSGQLLYVNGSLLAGPVRDTYFTGNVRTSVCAMETAESASCMMDNFIADESKGSI